MGIGRMLAAGSPGARSNLGEPLFHLATHFPLHFSGGMTFALFDGHRLAHVEGPSEHHLVEKLQDGCAMNIAGEIGLARCHQHRH